MHYQNGVRKSCRFADANGSFFWQVQYLITVVYGRFSQEAVVHHRCSILHLSDKATEATHFTYTVLVVWKAPVNELITRAWSDNLLPHCTYHTIKSMYAAKCSFALHFTFDWTSGSQNVRFYQNSCNVMCICVSGRIVRLMSNRPHVCVIFYYWCANYSVPVFTRLLNYRLMLPTH